MTTNFVFSGSDKNKSFFASCPHTGLTNQAFKLVHSFTKFHILGCIVGLDRVYKFSSTVCSIGPGQWDSTFFCCR